MVRARTDGTGRARHRARKSGMRAGDGAPPPEAAVPEAAVTEAAVPEAAVPEARGTGAPDARTRILDAAEELFAGDGFDATPTSRIAEQAGVAKALLFYYFPRKDG